MSFSLTVLGSSSALPTSKRFPTAQVLKVQERFFLIDCGEGTQMQLRKFKVPFSRIHHVFISHLHGDHVFGLFGLLSSMNLLGRNADLTLHAHAAMEHMIRYFTSVFGTELQFKILFEPFPARRHSLIYEDKIMTVETLPLKHRIPTAGFVFREKKRPLNIRKEKIEQLSIPYREVVRIKEGSDFVAGDGKIYENKELTLPGIRPRSYAYMTDTAYLEKITGQIRDVDLLYHEATFLESDRKLARLTGHSTALQAARIAQQAGAGKLLLGHFSSRYKNTADFVDEAKQVFENTVAVEDGDVFTVEETRDNYNYYNHYNN